MTAMKNARSLPTEPLIRRLRKQIATLTRLGNAMSDAMRPLSRVATNELLDAVAAWDAEVGR